MAKEDYPMALFGAEELEKTDEQARAAADRVESGTATQKQEGYSGVSYLHKRLPYLSHKHFWEMPVAHAVLKGIVENFVDLVLQPFPKVCMHVSTYVYIVGNNLINIHIQRV
jgi:hypothetical protein